MPDTRELLLADQMASGQFRLPWWYPAVARLKFFIRRVVVLTGGTPLAFVYAAIYRLHIRYAVKVLKRFAGTRAIYASRGMASGEIVYGVSDIDLVTIGDWGAEEHVQVIAALRRLSRLSPLYDPTLWQSAHTLAELRSLWETDYFFQSRFDQGRGRWKLLAGKNVIASLPEMPGERKAGALYMELKNWWLHYIMSSFGAGPTARDEIFRNSICYKSVAGVFNVAQAIEGKPFEVSRERTLAKAIASVASEQRPVLDRLAQSAKGRHLRYRGDIQDDSLKVLLTVIDSAHRAIPHAAVFRPASAGLSIEAEGMMLSEAAREHALGIAGHVAKLWRGYRSALLVPSVSCFALDDLMLFIEIAPEKIPSAGQIQELCRANAAARLRMRQRITLYLLLPNGACQLDLISPLEMWRVLLMPAANPDVFWLAGRKEFVLDGKPRTDSGAPRWSVFSNDLVREELNVRRSVMASLNPAALPDSLEIVRNLFRHLQLEIVARSTAVGYTLLPLTPAAVARAIDSWGVPAGPLLAQLREAYESELNGKPADVRPLIPPLMTMLESLR